MITTKVMPIALYQVTKTYNGADGCACGCRGTYAYPTWGEDHEAWQGKTSDRTVRARLNKINANLDEVEVDRWGSEVCYSLYNDDRTRVTRVYAFVVGE